MSDTKSNSYCFVACLIAFCAGFLIHAIVFGGENPFANRPTGRELEEAGRVNKELGDEQRRAVETVEAIRGLTEEANRSLSELRVVNRGQSDISAAIRAEAQILADYFRGVSRAVHSDDDMGTDQIGDTDGVRNPTN